MLEFNLHPSVYATGAHTGLRSMLEEIWVRSHNLGDGTIYIVSGFANFNGGARFYKSFKEHTERGGRLVAFLSGSTAQRLSSRQVVEALLECGAEVSIINRKRLMHAKCYGRVSSSGQSLIVSSGNFTGPGMAQNVEASLMLADSDVQSMSFSWEQVEQRFHSQGWLVYQPSLSTLTSPAWKLLYDETPGIILLEESDKITLVITLSHSDTARIQAMPNTAASKGTQYFWLSKDSFDFFPPLTIRNKRGYKGTLSAMINMHYVQLGIVDENCRVTFEAENNLDFRLGTGKLRNTRIANDGDIASITRISESDYELRVFKIGSSEYNALSYYATSFVGHKGKRYGYIDNVEFYEILNNLRLAPE